MDSRFRFAAPRHRLADAIGPRVRAVGLLGLALIAPPPGGSRAAGEVEMLPGPDRAGGKPFETLIQSRRSLREFSPDALDRATLGQLLWAAGGTTGEDRFMHRTTPSAGALYPLEFYLITAEGMARYDPSSHALAWIARTDARADLSAAALGQAWVARAPGCIVLAAEPRRTKVKYGERGDRYILMESGCACQNLLLQAESLGLGAVPVGAFDDDQVARVLGLPASQRALLIVAVGYPRDGR